METKTTDHQFFIIFSNLFIVNILRKKNRLFRCSYFKALNIILFFILNTLSFHILFLIFQIPINFR